MEAIGDIIISAYSLCWGAAFVILIYLVFRRIEIKKTEDFEKREN